MKNLAQSASLHAGENNAPSKPGTKQLGRVDGFDQDERARKRDEGSEVLRGLLAA
jgi:hypothetical protein